MLSHQIVSNLVCGYITAPLVIQPLIAQVKSKPEWLVVILFEIGWLFGGCCHVDAVCSCTDFAYEHMGRITVKQPL